LVDGSCSQRRRQDKPCQTSRNLLAGAPTRSCMVSGQISFQEKSPMELCLRQQGEIPLPCSIRTVALVVLAAKQVPACSQARRLAA
jgi:hypothetical protein